MFSLVSIYQGDILVYSIYRDGASLVAQLVKICLGRSPGERIGYPLQYWWVSLVAQMVKNPPAMRETWVQSLGREDPLEEGMATNFSILAWRIPWTEKPGGLWSIGLRSVRYDWSNWVHTHAYLPMCLNFLEFKFSAPNLACKNHAVWEDLCLVHHCIPQN